MGRAIFNPHESADTEAMILPAYPMCHPFRITGFSSSFASELLVIFIFSASHSSLVFNLIAIAPSAIHSVNGAETLKFEQAGTPPLQARIQSR